VANVIDPIKKIKLSTYRKTVNPDAKAQLIAER